MIYRIGDYKTGFKYLKDNKIINCKNKLNWIKSIKIPPQYQKVHIYENNLKILAFGFDSKGRKQVIYHPKYIKKRNQKKFNKLYSNFETFETIIKDVNINLHSKNKIIKEIAIIIYLIVNCGFRIGNKKYEQQNNSYGISTIKFKHLKFKDKKIFFDFIGKKGVRNKAECYNPNIYNYLKHKSIGKNYNDYVFSNISANKINEYLKKYNNITTKDIRTWNANIIFIKEALNNNINNALKIVAEKLHNTISVCKNNYIDPNIIEYIKKMSIK